jgi:hypothetical protein
LISRGHKGLLRRHAVWGSAKTIFFKTFEREHLAYDLPMALGLHWGRSLNLLCCCRYRSASIQALIKT